jgi:hypothetical protein
MASDDKVDFKLYRYTPSTTAAALFVALFFLTTIYHIYQLNRARAWYFIAFVIGGICKWSFRNWFRRIHIRKMDLIKIPVQIIGYVCRVLAHSHIESVPIYSVQTILILLAPPLYAASIYMVLGRLVAFLRAEKLSIVSVRWMTKIFVTGDVIAFVMQAAGMYGALMSIIC